MELYIYLHHEHLHLVLILRKIEFLLRHLHNKGYLDIKAQLKGVVP